MAHQFKFGDKVVDDVYGEGIVVVSKKSFVRVYFKGSGNVRFDISEIDDLKPVSDWIKIDWDNESTLPEPLFHQAGDILAPENRVRVWATWCDEDNTERYWWERYAHYVCDTTDDGDSKPYFIPHNFDDELVTITHWQPLPQPPK